jgi:tetratricopeptide (TPR) repeat protein
MPFAEKKSEPSPQPLGLPQLRQLWDGGRRGRCLREALRGWEALPARGDLHWLEDALRISGLTAEAFDLRVRLTRRLGADARVWESVIRSVLSSGDPWWARELLTEAGRRTRELEALNVEVELAVGDAADAIARWQRTYRDEAALDAAIGWWVRCGRVEEAERVLEAAPGLGLWRARLAIWRNQPDAARQLLDRLPSSPAVRCLQAVAAVQIGHLPQAEEILRTLLDSDMQAEAWSWLATTLRKQRRFAEAGRAADTANSMSTAFNLALWMERTLAAEYEHVGAGQPATESRLGSLLRSIGLSSERLRSPRMRRVAELEHAWALYPLGLEPDQPASALEALIERFGGNHTSDLTIADGGRLSSYPLPPDPGQLGVSIQLVLRTRGVEAVRGLYRELAPRAQGHPRFPLYQGEVELWMGAYEDAARIFRAILDEHPDVKWAWIGLGASAMLQGELAEAQTIWRRGLSITGCAGPTLYVYRGECHRRQGQLDDARRDLELAVRQKPERLSAWINLALLEGQGEILQRVERECVDRAPILMEQLSGGTVPRLEGVLEAMRGNRSSSRVTYHLWGRVWHFMTRVLDVPERDDGPRL